MATTEQSIGTIVADTTTSMYHLQPRLASELNTEGNNTGPVCQSLIAAADSGVILLYGTCKPSTPYHAYPTLPYDPHRPLCNLEEKKLKNTFLNIIMIIGSILNALAGKFSKDTSKKGKGTKTGTPHRWRSFYMSQYDWLNNA